MKGLLSIFVVCVAAVAYADTEKTLTLAQSIAHTMERSEVILNAVENEKQAAEEIISKSTAAYPKAYIKGEYSRSEPTGGNFGGGFGADEQTQDYYLHVEQPIYHGLRNIVATKAAKALRNARKADVETQQFALKNETVQRFFTVLTIQAQLALMDSSIALQKENLDILNKRQAAGDVRRSDVLKGENTLQELKIERTLLEELEAEARENLAFLVGKDAFYPLVTPSDTPLDLSKPEKLIGTAYQNRTELQSLDHQATAAELALDIVNRESHPDVDIEAKGYGYREGFLEDSKWDVRLTFSWELTGRKDRQARAAKKASQAEQVRLATEDARKQIARNVYLAIAEIKHSQKIQSQRQAHLAKAKELHQIVKQEYDAGETTALDVTTAFTDQRRSAQHLEREKLREQRLQYQLLLITGEDPWPATP